MSTVPHQRRPKRAGTSTSTLKKKIRDVERLLKKSSRPLSATVRSESERALEAYKHELKHAQSSFRDQKIAKKYHMVRFFERQKAIRRLRKLQRSLTTPIPDDATLKAQILNAQIDLNYTLHYPKGEKYISLFKDPTAESKMSEKRELIRKEIAQQMERGTLGAATFGEGEEVEEQEGVEEKNERVKREGKKQVKNGKWGKKVQQREVEEEEGDAFFDF
ncbi:18S rRNA maturation protein [Rhizina undulata]